MANEKAAAAAAPQNEQPVQPVQPVQPEPSNERTVLLNAEIDQLFVKQDAEKDRAAKLAISMDIYRKQQELATEIANIRKHERELELQEARNARKALLDAVIEAHEKVQASLADKKMSIDEKNAIYDDFKVKRDIVYSELTARYGSSTPAKKANDGTPKEPGTRGGTSAAIKELLLGHLAAGKTLTEAKKLVEAEGYSRGTTGTVATAMIVAGEATK